MEIERNCETVTGWSINTSMMIRPETAPGNQSFEEEKNQLLPNKDGNVKESAK